MNGQIPGPSKVRFGKGPSRVVDDNFPPAMRVKTH